ncbi:hypothetical protein SCUP234_10709 [Seiridium cupressi]
MHHPARGSISLLALVGITLLAGSVAAVCTNWTQERTNMDTGSDFSAHESPLVDQLACPADSDSNCYFTRKSYTITAERELLSEGGFPLGLPEDEADAIFQLAQDGYNNATTSRISNTTVYREFVTRTGTVTTMYAGATDLILQVKPAYSATLEYTPFLLYSWGTLSGCSNETLNNATIMATAPYLAVDEHQGNQTVIAGTWGSSAYNMTEDDKENGVASFVQRSTSSAIAGLMVSTVVLAFVL